MRDLPFVELLIYSILILTNLTIAWQWAKNGFWEVGIQVPPNFKAMGAILIGMTTFFIAGFIERKTQTFFLMKEDNILISLFIFLGIPLLFFLLVRYLILPRGLPEYNRAKHRTFYWMRKEYVIGVKKEAGNDLAKFPRALEALSFFEKAIKLQSKNLYFPRLIKRYKLGKKDTLINVNCPLCGFFIKIVPAEVDGTMDACPSCKRGLSFRAFKNNVEVIGLKRPKFYQIIKKKIIIIYIEMSFLLRMMNRFDEAIEALDKAEKLIDDVLRHNKNKDNLFIKENILFLKAEVAHTMGNKSLANRFYCEGCRVFNQPIENNFIKDLIYRLN